jgi:hypothetical protein
MPTLKEAKDKVRELSQKGLDVFGPHDDTAAEMKAALDPIDATSRSGWTRSSTSSPSTSDGSRSWPPRRQPDRGRRQDQGQPNKNSEVPRPQFVESGGYKNLIARGLKGGSWTTGDIELKTLLTEAAGGAATVATPTVLPGVVDIQFQPLTIADLFPQGSRRRR